MAGKGLPPWLKPGNPGNKGGNRNSGKRSTKVREACQKGAVKAVPILIKIVEDKKAKPSERVRAAEVLGRWAGVDVKQVEASLDGVIKVVWE